MDIQAFYSEDEKSLVGAGTAMLFGGLISLLLGCGLVITRPVPTGGALTNLRPPQACSPVSVHAGCASVNRPTEG